MNHKRLPIARANLRKKNKVGGVSLSDYFKLCCKAVLIKYILYMKNPDSTDFFLFSVINRYLAHLASHYLLVLLGSGELKSFFFVYFVGLPNLSQDSALMDAIWVVS